MKKLVALVAIVVLLALAAPGIAGFAAKSIAEDRVVFFNSEYNDIGIIKLENYQRNWFSSSAVISARFSDSYRDQFMAMINADLANEADIIELYKTALDGKLLFTVTLNHGPVMVNDGMKMGLGSATTELDASSGDLKRLREYLGVPYLLRQYSQLGFSGLTSFYGDAPPFKVDQATTVVQFSGFNYEGTANIYNGNIIVDAGYDDLSFDALSGKTTISGFSYTGNHQLIQPAVWVGMGRLGLASVLAEDALGEEVFSMKNLSLDMNVDVDSSGQTVNMDALYAIEKVTGAGDLDVTDVSFALRFGRLDITALNDIVEMNQTVQISDVPPEDLRAAVYQLAAASPTFEFGPLQTQWQTESFNAGLNVSFDGAGLPEYESFSIADTALWLQIINGDAYIDMSDQMALTLAAEYSANQLIAAIQAQGRTADPAEIEKVAREQAPVLLYNFIQQGIFEKTDAGYSGNVTLRDGSIEINGNPMPLGAM